MFSTFLKRPQITDVQNNVQIFALTGADSGRLDNEPLRKMPRHIRDLNVECARNLIIN